MNYSTLQSTLLLRLNMGSDDPLASSAGSLVNEGLHIVETQHPNGWPWLRRTVTLPTTASDDSYDFSTIAALVSTNVTVAKVISCAAAISQGYEPLTLISGDEAENYYWSTNTSNRIESYYVEGQTLYLKPAPSSAVNVQVRIVITEPDLTSATQSPLLPVQFHGAIIAAALQLYYITLQDQNRAAVAAQQLQDWVNRMMRYGREYVGAASVRYRWDW